MFVDKLLPAARQKLATIVDSAQVVEAAKLLRDAGTDIVAVCNPDGVLAGVITKTDVVGQISHCLGHSCVTPAASIMTRDVVVCRPGELLNDVWSTMKKRRLVNIPIVDVESRPIGMLNARDTLQILLNEVEDEESLLRDYVMNIGYR